MPISISKSPNWVPGKGFTFSNQHGGTGGMSMGGGATPPVPPVPEPVNDIFTKMLMHFDDAASVADSTISATTPMQGILSPDGTKAYIGSWAGASGNGIHVIDVASGAKTQTFETEGNKIHQLTLNSTGTKIYGTNYNQNKVYIVDTTNGSFSSVTTGTGVHSSAITTNDKFLFVACQNAGLYRIDLTAATPSATLLGDTTWGAFAPVVSPDGTKLYVSLGSSVKVYSLNQDTGAISLLSTLTGFSGAYVVTKTTNTAYYSNYTNGTVSPVYFSSSTKGTDITVGAAPYGSSVSPDGKKLYVANYNGNTISIIDISTNSVTTTFAGFTNPYGVVATNSKLFVSNNGNSTITVKDVSSLSDSAQSPLTQYRVGTVNTSTTQSKFGGKSLLLNGVNTNKLQFANPKGKAINFGSSNWTMEGWFWFNQKNVAGGYQPIIVFTNFDGNYPGPELYLESNSCLTMAWRADGAYGTRSAISSSFNPDVNRWYHIAVIRNGGTVTMYVDGTSVGSQAVSGNIYNPDYIGLGVFGHAQSIAHFNGYMDGIRIQVGEAVYTGNTGNFTPAAAPFTDGKNLLLHFDGANNSTTMTDSSTYGKTATAYNGAVISTSQSKFGGSSLYLPGTSGNRVVVTSSSDFAFGTGDFTVESWINASSWSSGIAGTYYNGILDTRTAEGTGLWFGFNGSRKLILFYNGGIFHTGNTIFNLNSWYHVALSRKNSIIYIYVNGVLDSTTSTEVNLTHTGMTIGCNYAGSAGVSFNGYIDEFRVTKGTALYSDSFTVPTTAPTANSYTKLLMNFDSKIKDETTSSLYSYAVGSTAVISSAQSKFGGSSLKMSGGTTDYVKIHNDSQPIALLDRPFTIEGWFWLNANNTSVQQPLINMRNSGRWDGPIIYIESDNTLKALFSNAGTAWDNSISTGFVPTAQAWHHIALVREYNAGPVKLYCDGSLKGTANTTSSIFLNDCIFIGHDPWFISSNQTLNGYIDEVRILLDACSYGVPYTPPTSQLSASTNTKLMLNFNSDYADSSTGPSTVTAYGGAVLSSAQSKFGGNSMKFTRSTGSRLTVSNAGGKLQFGSSDFCIETWLYLNSVPGGGYPDCFFILGYGADSSAAGFDYFLGTTNIVVAPTDYFNPLISAPHGMTTNKWYHVALSRKGGRLNVFIDGVLKGSASISGAVYTIPSSGANANLIAIGAGEPMAATAGNFDGYMDDFRITIGDSVYSSAFPSAAPFTLIG